MKLVRTIGTGWRLLRHLGPGWALFRLRYAVRRRAGWLEKAAPTGGWPQVRPARRPRIFPAPAGIGGGCLEEARDLAAGTFRLFSFHRVAAGIPPDWHRNQLSGERAEAARHWSRLGDFAFGDIKAVWELSRFAWAFALARAYAKSGDEQHAELFWRLFADWMARNPPNQGANWMCGQEATFRLMAATFAVDVMAEARASTAARQADFAAFVVATGRRIAANLDYALSQSNNHGISEAVGLVTAALLVPEDPKAESWRRRGVRALERQLAELVYADGAFAQHSATYHRVLVHDLLWYAAVMRAFGRPVSGPIRDAALKAVRFVGSLMTAETGSVPLYGASDGANILPLADADYGDFRPLVQAGHAVFAGRKSLAPGPWDELADWMAGTDAAQAGLAAQSAGNGPEGCDRRVHHGEGGCLVWRHGASRLFLRCPSSFRHRPGHADLLHVDLEWRGVPVAIDAGTYSYNACGPAGGDLKEAAVHNTVTFDGKEPMEKLGRFLYLPWPSGWSGWIGAHRFAAEHDGWQRIGCRHARSVEAEGDDAFVVTDDLAAATESLARVHWLLPDWPYRWNPGESGLVLETPRGAIVIEWDFPGAAAEVVRGAAGSHRGWCAPCYFHRQPALSLSIAVRCAGRIRGRTRFAPAAKVA